MGCTQTKAEDQQTKGGVSVKSLLYVDKPNDHKGIDESILCLSPSLVSALGVDGSTLVCCIHRMTKTTDSKKNRFYNGYKWAAIDFEWLSTWMRFITKQELERVFENLVKKGVLVNCSVDDKTLCRINERVLIDLCESDTGEIGGAESV
jgi:hypothetical protein